MHTVTKDIQPPMNDAYRNALTELLYQLADDELVLGHRWSEWLGMAPDLDEDVAFSSISQDEIGHATYFFSLLEDLGEGHADMLAFERPTNRRSNAQLTEQPNGDWAHTIVRGYLYDVFEQVRLRALTQSSYPPLRQGAEKMLREERYHLLHMEKWFERLALAGGEARQRLTSAITAVWDDVGDLFTLGSASSVMVNEGIFPLSESESREQWEDIVRGTFDRLHLAWPGTPQQSTSGGRQGIHGPALAELLQTMDEVRGTNPQARW